MACLTKHERFPAFFRQRDWCKTSRLCPRRAGRPGMWQVVFCLVLALVVSWHYFYVPLHLVAHDHLNGPGAAGHLRGQADPGAGCGAEIAEGAKAGSDSDRSPRDGEHEPHPESDHLAGFWTVAAPSIELAVAGCPAVITTATDVAAPSFPVSCAHERGPPAGMAVFPI